MDDLEFSWPAPLHDFLLGQDEVHVWSFCLAETEETLAHLEAVLAPEEQIRAAAFRFDRDRSRYVTGRATLRTILGRYLGAAPESIQLTTGPNGKPLLNEALAASGLQFNLAHCEDAAILALTCDRPVGLDIERLRPVEDAEEMAEVFCSPREFAEFKAVAKSEKDAAFFRIWTRKEALLKATGAGIGHLLRDVEVSFDTDAEGRFLKLPKEAGFSAGQWNLRVLQPARGYLAAIAFPGKAGALSCWQWKKVQATEYEYS